MNRLTGLIRSLRAEKGCPWDKEQNPASMAGYLLEEAHELSDAIESGDIRNICEELGDVLFHLLFIIDCFEEKGLFGLKTVIRDITDKMKRRHPHVFGENVLKTADAVREQWQRIKAEEKKGHPEESLLASVPRSLPALMRAFRISERAAGTKFDWEDISGVMEKVEEEWGEFKAEMRDLSPDPEKAHRLTLEFGDLLFTLVNLARFNRMDPERALHAATKKFEERFRFMEKRVAESSRDIRSIPQAEKDALWEEAKAHPTT